MSIGIPKSAMPASDLNPLYYPETNMAWMVDAASGSDVLVLGCSSPALLLDLARNDMKVHAIDSSPARIAYVVERLRTEPSCLTDAVNVSLSDPAQVPADHHQYNSVLIDPTFAMAANPRQILQYAAQALKPDGVFALTTVWGYAGPEQEHAIYFVSNLMTDIPAGLTITLLDVKQGHIYLVARKGDVTQVPAEIVYEPTDAELLAGAERAALQNQLYLGATLAIRERQVKEAWTIIAELKQQIAKDRDPISDRNAQHENLKRTPPKYTSNKRRRTLKYRMKKKWRKLKYKYHYKLSYNYLLSSSRKESYILICGAYPGRNKEYGGEFVRERAKSYLKSGKSGFIIELNNNNIDIELEKDGLLTILRAPLLASKDIVRNISKQNSPVLVHNAFPALMEQLKRHIDEKRLIYWFHGADVRDSRRLYFNFDTVERERQRFMVYQFHQDQIKSLSHVLTSPQIRKVFVSDYLQTIAERDIGVRSNNVTVIHNFIDTTFFTPIDRPLEQFRRIALLRPFKRGNYAVDIAIQAICLLRNRQGFMDLDFTLRGFGDAFDEFTVPLQNLSNVRLEEKYSSREEVRELHRQHGIFLCPTRHDTQGVSLGEAMASGMACITHDVAAIPQFVDRDCGVLVRPNDPAALAEAIWELAHNPDRARRLGAAAAQRVRKQCSFENTIGRELDLIQMQDVPA